MWTSTLIADGKVGMCQRQLAIVAGRTHFLQYWFSGFLEEWSDPVKRWIKIFLMALGGAFLLGLIVFQILLILASRAPDFYLEKVQLDPVQASQMSDQLLQKTTALAGQVQHPGRWYQVFTEDEINAWLAVDLPKNHRHLLPPELSDPRIKLESDTVRIAVKARHGLLSGILTIDIHVQSPEENTIVLSFRRVSLGALPLPFRPMIERLKNFAAQAGWEIREMQKDGLPTFVIRIPPVADEKGQIRELTWLRIADGRVELSGMVRKR